MTNPIPPLNSGFVGSTAGMKQAPIRGADGRTPGLSDASLRLPSAGSPSDLQEIPQIFAALSELLQGLGGGLENDKALRALIALIILLALLQNSEASQGSTNSALDLLGAGRGGNQQFLAMQSTSTTIVVEQTSTTLVMGSADQISAAFGGGSAQGEQIDFSI